MGFTHGAGRCFFFHLFLQLFVCFPCAGNFGILLGFWCILPIALAFLCLVFCPTHHIETTYASSEGWIPESYKSGSHTRYHVLTKETHTETHVERHSDERHSESKASTQRA